MSDEYSVLTVKELIEYMEKSENDFIIEVKVGESDGEE